VNGAAVRFNLTLIGNGTTIGLCSLSQNGVTNTAVIDTPAKDGKQPGSQTVRAPTRLNRVSTDYPWQRIFEQRFLLSVDRGGVRAMSGNRETMRIQRE
jgi:hypothetical protein